MNAGAYDRRAIEDVISALRALLEAHKSIVNEGVYVSWAPLLRRAAGALAAVEPQPEATQEPPQVHSSEEYDRARAARAPRPKKPRAHIAGANCWCKPDIEYQDPETGQRVYLHKGLQ